MVLLRNSIHYLYLLPDPIAEIVPGLRPLEQSKDSSVRILKMLMRCQTRINTLLELSTVGSLSKQMYLLGFSQDYPTL
jgi:hypothetical protein